MTNNAITDTVKNQDAAPIREMIYGWADAIRARDSARLTANFAPDLLQFDLVGPLQSPGQSSANSRAHQWLSSFEGPVDYEIKDLTIETGGNIAFSYSLNRVKATTTGGQKIEMWWRTTIGFREIDGKWAVVHIHSSVPFDPADGTASLGLKP